MRSSYYICNAFSNTVSGGNPAAVCLLETAFDQDTMQQIAADINLPATAFCVQKDSMCYQIRWFSPSCEIQLCGHATLAAAQLIFNRHDHLTEIHFIRDSVTLICQRQDNGVRLLLPHNPTITIEIPHYADMAIGNGIMNAAETETNNGFIVLEYDSANTLKAMQPNFDAIKNNTLYGIIATSWVGDGQADFGLRVFVPQYGYNEDQATGSAQPVLWDYWHKKTSKSEFTSTQYSARQAQLHVASIDQELWVSGQCIVLEQRHFTL